MSGTYDGTVFVECGGSLHWKKSIVRKPLLFVPITMIGLVLVPLLFGYVVKIDGFVLIDGQLDRPSSPSFDVAMFQGNATDCC